MSVTFELPRELEEHFRQDFQDLDAEAKEAFLVAMYRRGKLSQVRLSRALGLDRLDTEAVLQKHHVTEDLGTVDDYLADARGLEKLRDPGRG